MAAPVPQKHPVRAAAALAAALFLASCGGASGDARDGKSGAAPGSSRAEAREYRLNQGSSLVLSLSSGLAALDPAKLAVNPAPFSVKESVAQLLGTGDGSVLVAVNRLGLRRLSVSKTGDASGSAFLVRMETVAGADAEFAGRTVGAAFVRDGLPVFFLYRHPDDASAGEPAVPHAFVAVDGLSARLWEKAPALDDGRYLFSAFALSGDFIYLQSRLDTAEGFDSYYSAWNPGSGRVEALTRTEFERRLRPTSPAAAGPALEACMASLAGPIVARAAMPDGTRGTFLRGDIDQAVQASAYADASWTAVLASDGRLAALGPEGGTVSLRTLERPVQRAVFRDVAVAGGLIVALWEEDLFPDVGRSGLLIIAPNQ